MAFLFDNLTAFLVGATLLVGLVFVQQRGRQSAVEATVRYRAEVQTASFLETLARDLENARTKEQAREAHGPYVERVGADGKREGDHDLERALSIYGTAARTDWFEFVTLADPEAGPNSALVPVAYLLRPTGATAAARGVARPVYEVVRYECARPCKTSADWAPRGGSAPSVVGLQVRAEPGGPSGRIKALPPRVGVVVEAAYETPARQAGDQAETGEFGVTRQAATVRVYAAGTGGRARPPAQDGATGIPPPPWVDAYTPPPAPTVPSSPTPGPSSPTSPPPPPPTNPPAQPKPSPPSPAPPPVVRPSGDKLPDI